MFHKLVYKIGAHLRNKELYSKYNFLKKSESWSLEELKAHQLSALKKLVKHAYANSEYYKNKLDGMGISPEDIISLSDLQKLPIFTKQDLLDNSDKMQIKDGFDKLFYCETSGSTGEPFVWYRDSEWDSATRATILRGYSWFNVKPWEKNGYFWGFSFDNKSKSKVKVLDFLLNRFRVFSYSDKEIHKFAKKLRRAKYLEGYSSMIYEIAKIINKNNHTVNFNLKMVKGTSEKIYEKYQDEVMKAFGKKIISEYGAAETGIIAFECPYGNMHICMENVIVEEIDGDAIITNLVSNSLPIIRYKLGDAITLGHDTECACGMKHEVVTNVLGRVGKVIQGTNQTYPSLTLYYVFKNMVIKYDTKLIYQAVQHEKGKLMINLADKASPEIAEKIKQECDAYYKNDVKVTVISESLVRDYSKKHSDFVSYID